MRAEFIFHPHVCQQDTAPRQEFGRNIRQGAPYARGCNHGISSLQCLNNTWQVAIVYDFGSIVFNLRLQARGVAHDNSLYALTVRLKQNA